MRDGGNRRCERGLLRALLLYSWRYVTVAPTARQTRRERRKTKHTAGRHNMVALPEFGAYAMARPGLSRIHCRGAPPPRSAGSGTREKLRRPYRRVPPGRSNEARHAVATP